MHTSISKFLFGLSLVLLAGGLHAQEEESDGKIHLKITKEIDGETSVFEGEYDNEKQMHADPNYREFVGEETPRPHFYFGGSHPDLDVHLKHFGGSNGAFAFGFGDSVNFDFDLDIDSIVDIQMHGIMSDEERAPLEHKMKDLEMIIEQQIHSNLNDSLMEQLSVILGPGFPNPPRAHPNHFNTQSSKRIVVEYVEEDDDLGKRAQVKDSDLLSLEKLDFYPNPSNGKFQLNFKVPKQGPLAVTIYDLDGKEIFVRSFDQFGGYFSEQIDLSGQNAGLYLLEVKHDKKRLTRKIMIE